MDCIFEDVYYEPKKRNTPLMKAVRIKSQTRW